jgi:hypothetical protein
MRRSWHVVNSSSILRINAASLSLADLGVQPLDLPLMRRFGVSPDAGLEGAPQPDLEPAFQA